MAETEDTAPPNSVPPARFDLVTLGVAALVRPDGRLALDRSKQLALLTYLHAAPRRTARREQLCALLWGDSPPEAAGRAFRSTLSRMRAAIGEAATESAGAEVTLHVPIASDRDQFLSAVRAGDLERAVALYTGPFFPSYSDSGSAQFEEWVDLERARLQEFFVRSADSLVRHHLELGHHRLAKEVARRVRVMAPDAEAGWRLLLESLIAGHDDLAARAEAEGLRRWLSHNEREPDRASASLLKLISEGAASAESVPDGSLISELVGREQEFSAVLDAWAHASRGAPRHLHVMANAGLGKTRLLAEVASRIKALGGCVIPVRATPGERDVDYALVAELARALGNGPGAGTVNPASTPVLVHLQPALASRFPQATPLRTERDLTMQRAQALGELLSAIAEETPVALLVDDLHWADRESRRILGSMSERLGRNRVLLLTAGRPADLDLPGQAAILPLPPLTVADTEALLASAGTPPSQEWSDRLARALHRASRGSPLLILETLLLARERGELCLEGGSWSAPDLDCLVAKVESARALETRILRLEPVSRQYLLLLATAGTPLRTDQLEAFLGGAAGVGTSVPEELERAGYLSRRGDAWDISHDEVAAASLELAPVEERKLAHAMLGSWLAGGVRNDRGTLSRAARHLLLGGQESVIAPVFRRWVMLAHEEGDRSTALGSAMEFLGEAAPDALRLRLVRSLPIHLRHRTGSRISAAIAGAVLILAATLAFIRSGAPPRPEAELLFIGKSSGGRTPEIYRLPVSHERWRIGDSIRLSEAVRMGSWSGGPGQVAVTFDGRVAFAQTVQDSGVTDLFIREAAGSVRRVTDAAGDDVGPSWSPDGRYLAFQTARFTPRGDEDSDIAIIDIATGQVRQVTSGPDYDGEPRWSPDGTRIAFHRSRTQEGGARLCWTTVDAAVSQCMVSLPGVPGGIIGWRDHDRFLVHMQYENSESKLLEITLSTGASRVIDAPGFVRGSLSPNGKWLAASHRLVGSRIPESEVFPLDESWLRRPIVSDSSPDGYNTAWLPDPDSDGGDWFLRITSPDSCLVGVAHQMAAEATDNKGARRSISQATVHWRSTDPTVATVDATSGLLSPRTTGSTWVIASAGGWRLDSTLVHVSGPSYKTLFTELWADPRMPAWEFFGTPIPVVSADGRGQPAFLNNGDNAYDSGALTRAAFTGHFGVGFETTLYLPIRRLKWQTIRLKLGSVAAVFSSGVNADGCSFDFPAGEGADQADIISVSALPDGKRLVAGRDLADGRGHRFRMQVFPDHTCGIAVDGRPIWRSARPMDARFPFRLVLYGRSVGAQLLVGPIEMWEGVKPGVDWEQRGHRPAPRRSRRTTRKQ